MASQTPDYTRLHRHRISRKLKVEGKHSGANLISTNISRRGILRRRLPNGTRLQRYRKNLASAIYCLVSKEGIPKIKVGIEARYSKKNFDIAKGIAEPEAPKEYTIAEAMEKFGMTRDQIYHYVKTYNITRTKRGKYTYISRKELDDLLAPPTI